MFMYVVYMHMGKTFFDELNMIDIFFFNFYFRWKILAAVYHCLLWFSNVCITWTAYDIWFFSSICTGLCIVCYNIYKRCSQKNATCMTEEENLPAQLQVPPEPLIDVCTCTNKTLKKNVLSSCSYKHVHVMYTLYMYM